MTQSTLLYGIDNSAGYPDKIAEYLGNKGFRVLKAKELRQFMIESINNGNACEKLVVFSQDVIPDTVAENYFSNTTLRTFLDNGGSILWIGDIPGFYIGKPEQKRDDKAWQIGIPVFMFGVVPVFADSVKCTVNITNEGKSLGLKHKWSGTRPVLPDSGLVKLAESEVIFYQPYTTGILPKEKLELIRGSIESKIEEVEAEARIELLNKLLGGKLRIKFSTPDVRDADASIFYFHTKLPNAWFKNYNEDYPCSGLFRLWDYGPRIITNQMLEELYRVIKSIENEKFI